MNYKLVAVVMNIMVVIETSTSVTVSWMAINFPGITGYMVYYSQTGNRKRQANDEQSVDVSGSSTNAVRIENLVTGAMYQFTVVAVATLNGAEITGQRAIPVNMTIMLPITTQGEFTPSNWKTLKAGTGTESGNGNGNGFFWNSF